MASLSHTDLTDIVPDLFELSPDSWELPKADDGCPDVQHNTSENSSPTATALHTFSGTENDTADDMQPYEQLAVERSQANGRAERKKGRPRRYDLPDTFVTAQPGEIPARKRGRGAKPKYLFKTEEDAMAHRRHRNRTAALSSYYRRKEQANILKQQQAELLKEQAALQQLLDRAEDPAFDKDGAREALQQTRSGLQTLQSLRAD